jgi:predicted DNA-binding transcriptional regulator YafY
LFSAVADEHSDVRESALILMQKIWEVDPQVREKMTDEAISIVSAESEHSDVKTEALSLLRKAITQSP